MIGVDTNILVRLAVGDGGAHAADAVELVARAVQDGEEVYINSVVLAEYTWTLKRSYRSSRAVLADAVRGLFDRPPFRLFDENVVSRALDLFDASSADFGDCLISALNETAKARITYSFDYDASELPNFAKP
jgi:predicted nucleic-acid-binding protein